MPNQHRFKGARLYLQPERRNNADQLIEHSIWVIRDGPRKRSTRCGPNDRDQAERKLAEYIAEKHQPEQQSSTNPDQILIADILNLYLKDKAPTGSRPMETASRVSRLLNWWGNPEQAQKDLIAANQNTSFYGVAGDVRGATCRCFATTIKAKSQARRLLEDLRAALNYAFQEGMIDRKIPVTLPQKPQPRDRWLSRNEAANMVWRAWRYRDPLTGFATRKHVARYILTGLYTGTRKAAILHTAFDRRPGCGFIDLKNGVFYRLAQGKRQTKKRQPPIRVPARLLAHMRRWKQNDQKFLIEYLSSPITDIGNAFESVAHECGYFDVTPHTLRHTAATWAMQNGGDAWKIAGYLGMSLETLVNNYGHHSPEHLDGAGDVIAHRNKAKITPTNPDRKTGT